MKTFKNLSLILGIGSFIFSAAACGSSNRSSSEPYKAANVATVSPADSTTSGQPTTISNVESAEAGLDLQAVAELAKKAKNAEDFERLLNQPNSVNNLDLDEDGQADYISVTEFKDGTKTARGYSLTVDLGEGGVQEIATIQLERDNPNDKTIDVYIAGNQEIYGTDDYYSGTWNYDDSSFSSWSYGAHPYYYSSYRYGSYPTYYKRYPIVGVSSYRSKMQSSNSSSIFKKIASLVTKNKLTSPNAGKSATSIKAPLSSPTVAQQTYQKTNPSRTVRTSPSYSSSSSSSTTRSSSSPSYSSPSRSFSSSPSSSSSSYSSRSSSSSSTSSSSSKSSSSSSSSRSSSRRK